MAYAGDGYTDYEAASSVPAHLRYARANLAESLQDKGENFRSFSVWSEIVDSLLQPPASG